MKTSLAIKVLLLLPLVLFVDYIVMLLFGSVSCLMGCDDDFYCGPYCLTGKIILGISVVVVLFLIFQEINKIAKTGKNGSSIKK